MGVHLGFARFAEDNVDLVSFDRKTPPSLDEGKMPVGLSSRRRDGATCRVSQRDRGARHRCSNCVLDGPRNRRSPFDVSFAGAAGTVAANMNDDVMVHFNARCRSLS